MLLSEAGNVLVDMLLLKQRAYAVHTTPEEEGTGIRLSAGRLGCLSKPGQCLVQAHHIAHDDQGGRTGLFRALQWPPSWPECR